MLRFFKSPQPAALFVIPFIVIGLWWTAFSECQVISLPEQMPLWNMVQPFFASLPVWTNTLIMIALISIQAVYLNLLLNKHEVLYKNSYLPSLFFVIVASSAADFLHVHPIHWINLLLLFLLDKSFGWLKQERPRASLFDCGFLAAIASLLYFPAFAFFILLVIALAILRPFILREWLIAIIGFFLPYFFLSVILFWQDGLAAFWNNFGTRFLLYRPFFNVSLPLSLQVLGILLGLILLYAMLRLRNNYYKNTIRTRSYQQIVFFSFLLACGGILWIREFRIDYLIILAVPASVFLSYLFVSVKKRKWFSELLLWILLILIVWNHFLPNLGN